MDQNFPDMFIGFANDLDNFEISIIHEALHCLRWDEDIVEKKSQELHQLWGGKEMRRWDYQETYTVWQVFLDEVDFWLWKHLHFLWRWKESLFQWIRK